VIRSDAAATRVRYNLIAFARPICGHFERTKSNAWNGRNKSAAGIDELCQLRRWSGRRGLRSDNRYRRGHSFGGPKHVALGDATVVARPVYLRQINCVFACSKACNRRR
jgi:hypothetical protein